MAVMHHLQQSTAMPSQERVGRRWLDDFVGRCQLAAGHLVEVDPVAVIPNIRDWVADLPVGLGVAEQLVIRRLLDQLFARLACVANVDRSPAAARAFFEFAAANTTPRTWRAELLHAIDRFAAACAQHSAGLPPRCLGDTRLTAAVTF